jgi:hypothetical protein
VQGLEATTSQKRSCQCQPISGVSLTTLSSKTFAAVRGTYVPTYVVRITIKRPEGRIARWFVFKTKNPNLGKFWRALHTLKNVYIFMAIWNILTEIGDILRPFGTFRIHLVHFFRSWYYVPRKIWQPCLIVRPEQRLGLVPT